MKTQHRSQLPIHIVLLAALGCGASPVATTAADPGNPVVSASAALTQAPSDDRADSSQRARDGDHRHRPADDGGLRLMAVPRGEPITTEQGGEVIVDVSLASAPPSDVTVGVAVSDETEAEASPTSLVFTPCNWNRPQPVLVGGRGDLFADGAQPYELVLSAAAAGEQHHGQHAERASLRLALSNLDRAAFAGIGGPAAGDFMSTPLGISADGRVVVGYGESPSGRQALRFSPEPPLTRALGGLSSEARAVSRAGNVIAGVALDADGSPTAVRWTDDTGPEVLPLSPPFPASLRTEANGISGDGLVVVGGDASRRSPIDHGGVTWTRGQAEGRFVQLFGAISGANEDASILVGYILPSRASPWQLAIKTGQTLPFPPRPPTCFDPSCGLCITPGTCSSRALGVSRNGSVTVGWAKFAANPPFAVAWAPGPDGNPLATVLSSLPSAEALGLSGDGTTVVGFEGGVAMRWRGGSSTDIATLLVQSGVSVAGWQLTAARAASDDGQVIVGEGLNPDGNPQGWIAVLPP